MMDLVAFVHRIHQGDLEQELKLDYSTEFVQLSKFGTHNLGVIKSNKF